MKTIIITLMYLLPTFLRYFSVKTFTRKSNFSNFSKSAQRWIYVISTLFWYIRYKTQFKFRLRHFWKKMFYHFCSDGSLLKNFYFSLKTTGTWIATNRTKWKGEWFHICVCDQCVSCLREREREREREAEGRQLFSKFHTHCKNWQEEEKGQK